jgi:hypothetical protein
MSEGYPDYARLSLSGGYLLYGDNGNIPNNDILFQGYVGSWPYINLMTAANGSTENMKLVLQFCTDATFAKIVGFIYIIRSWYTVSNSQYSCLSPWLQFFYGSDSGHAVNWSELGLYATVAPARQVGLASMDVPIASGNPVVNADTTTTITPSHIQPGDAVINISTALANWQVQFWYWSYDNAAWKFVGLVNSSMNAGGGSYDMPMIDAPYEIRLINNTAANGNINYAWLSK